MYFIRVLSYIAFIYLFINLTVYAVIPLLVSESYMLKQQFHQKLYPTPFRINFF
jgi:membrane-anchored glycerophosphoryl diester phosphodiesterase (GDPDase)